MSHAHSLISVINELLRYAEENDKDILKDEDDDGNTALHLACIKEKFQAAKVLILAGADPEDRYGNENTSMSMRMVNFYNFSNKKYRSSYDM